jgi:ATP-binding cassette subfamily B protein
LPPGEEQCPQCSRELETPPSTWALLRLWRFARPYRWELLGGFVLLLLGTAATLVPPYLTMPLMDKVLIPFQNGVPIDIGLVKLYLAGLLGAALVAWVLGWARTYLLARCRSASAPTCAPPPTNTCSSCRSSISAASAPAT